MKQFLGKEEMKKIVIFTDMDGTLIDHDTYSFHDSLPAIELTKQRSIPLVFCSSKTRAEIEEYRKKMDIFHPFVSENGGGIFIPKGYFQNPFPFDKEDEKYQIIELGTPYETLCRVFREIREELRLDIRGYSDMDPEEVSRICGLKPKDARLAGEREYDEPFLIASKEKRDREEELVEAIRKRGFGYTKGGRFFHLIGKNDKGKAVEILSELFKEEFADIKTIGIGDSTNDKSLLERVDVPVLVQKPDGGYDPSVTVSGLIKADGIGPKGWNRFVTDYLKTAR